MGYFRRSPPFPCVPGGRVETAFVPRGFGGFITTGWLNFEDFLLKLGECGQARMGEEQGALVLYTLHFVFWVTSGVSTLQMTESPYDFLSKKITT